MRRTHAYVNHVSAWKMLIAEKLPQCDKALYLDTDILVRSDLSELFVTDLGEAYIAVVGRQIDVVAKLIGPPFAHEWFRHFAKTPFFTPRDRKALHLHPSAGQLSCQRPKGLAKIAYKVWKHLDKRFWR